MSIRSTLRVRFEVRRRRGEAGFRVALERQGQCLDYDVYLKNYTWRLKPWLEVT
jgi:hypothetical protein